MPSSDTNRNAKVRSRSADRTREHPGTRAPVHPRLASRHRSREQAEDPVGIAREARSPPATVPLHTCRAGSRPPRRARRAPASSRGSTRPARRCSSPSRRPGCGCAPRRRRGSAAGAIVRRPVGDAAGNAPARPGRAAAPCPRWAPSTTACSSPRVSSVMLVFSSLGAAPTACGCVASRHRDDAPRRGLPEREDHRRAVAAGERVHRVARERRRGRRRVRLDVAEHELLQVRVPLERDAGELAHRAVRAVAADEPAGAHEPLRRRGRAAVRSTPSTSASSKRARCRARSSRRAPRCCRAAPPSRPARRRG